MPVAGRKARSAAKKSGTNAKPVNKRLVAGRVASKGVSKKKAARKSPRIGRPPGKPSAETRASIVAAAREEFVRVGYERATNRAIAAEAGITAAAIYQYFESKSALYTAVVTETLEELMPRLRAAAEATPTARAALSAILREQLSIEQHVTSARFLAAVPLELQRHPELAQAVVQQPSNFVDLLVECVKRGVRGGEIVRDKADAVVTMYIAALIGLSIYGSTVPDPFSQSAVTGFIDLLEGTLFR